MCHLFSTQILKNMGSFRNHPQLFPRVGWQLMLSFIHLRCETVPYCFYSEKLKDIRQHHQFVVSLAWIKWTNQDPRIFLAWLTECIFPPYYTEVGPNPSNVKDCWETGWLWLLPFGMSHCKTGSHTYLLG